MNGVLPLGIRNNNPLNIKWATDNRWIGQTGQQDGFVIFDTAEHGLRAAYKIFQVHYDEGAKNLDGFIRRWSATDQASYIETVSNTLSLDPYAPFTLSNIAVPLARAMVGVECGHDYLAYYALSVYETAWTMASNPEQL